jgi:hypothetical protein
VEKTIEAPGDYLSELGRINSSKAVRGGNDTQLRSSLACSLSSVPFRSLSLAQCSSSPSAPPPRFSFYSKTLLITDPIHFLPVPVNSDLSFSQNLPLPHSRPFFVCRLIPFLLPNLFFFSLYSLRGVCVCMC